MSIFQFVQEQQQLAFFDKNRKTELRVDASPVGLGAILCQIDIQDDGTSRPVAYLSRSLSNVERRNSQIEREALGIKFGCLKFDHYLSGEPDFTIITDHRPLLGLYKPGSRVNTLISDFAMNRVQRMPLISFPGNQPLPAFMLILASTLTPE